MVGAPEPVLERFGALLRILERLFRRCVPMRSPPELGVGESDPVRHLDAEGGGRGEGQGQGQREKLRVD